MWGTRPLPDPSDIYAALPEITDLQPLPSGGQKAVYRACHATLGDVVVKLFRGAPNDERLRREIEAVTARSFANVPRIYSSGIISYATHESAYILEQFIGGETLRTLLDRERTLPVGRVLDLMDRFLSTAVELEASRLVHRDIKPENIVVDAAGQFWLLDFGIARHLDKESITVSGAQPGPSTPGYAPPEQFANLKRDIDIRADLFAIGVVAYESLSGTHPFRDGAVDRYDAYRRTATVDAPPLIIQGDTQKQLAGFIGVLMSKHPSRRPMSALQAQEWFLALRPTVLLGKNDGSA